MRRFNRSNISATACARLFASLVCLMILVQPAAPGTIRATAPPISAYQKTAAMRAPSPKEILALGIFHFNNDDISGLAENSFKQLLTPKYTGTDEAESARYYLASYYERKFYIQRAKWRRDDWNSLKQAVAEYRRYTDQYYNSGKSKWLSEAFFNLAIVYMQLNDRQNAVNELSKIKSAASRDPVIYVYQIIWSPQSKDVIDANLSAARVADITLAFTMKYPYFEQRLPALTQWCQGEKSK